MNVQRLVAMANDIANFFGSDPDPTSAADQVANHLKKFWEPRMRMALIEHGNKGGAGLQDLVIAALPKLESHR